MEIETLSRDWDVVVVGAGVAGALGALQLAHDGLRVLLVEKSRWPREKVCGGCLNATASRALATVGINLTHERSYARMRLACNGRAAELQLPRGVAITRKRLDAMVVTHAISAGACFLPGIRAVLGRATDQFREITLRQGSQTRTINARVVLDCGGIASRLLPDADWRIASDARIGVGANLAAAPSWYRPGVIHMACAQHGYGGLVRAENDTLNVAAALDPGWIQRSGGPSRAIAKILVAAGFPVFDGLHEARWLGTPHLTRRRRKLGAQRLLILGDAAGYVEPFTGEGMAWAMAEAVSVAPLVCDAVAHWNDDIVERWCVRHAQVVRTRQRVCRGISLLVRRPRLLAALLSLVDAAPTLVSPLSMWLNHDFGLAGILKE